jgi:hypothetical protein
MCLETLQAGHIHHTVRKISDALQKAQPVSAQILIFRHHQYMIEEARDFGDEG